MTDKISRIERLRAYGSVEAVTGIVSASLGAVGAAGSVAVEATRNMAQNFAHMPLQQMELERIGVISTGTFAISALLIATGIAEINAGVRAHEEAQQLEATIPVIE